MSDTPIIPVPCIGTLGWVRDSANKFDLLMSHFMLSDYNQTYVYKGKVTSLPRIMELHGNNANRVIEDLKQGLKSYLGRYYDSVSVEVENSNPDDPSINATLSVKIGVLDKGIQRVYGRILQSTDGKIDKILKINNG